MTQRITDVPASYDPSAFRQIMRDFDQRFRTLERLTPDYAVTNFTPTRTLDMGSATATDIGNFLATLISDLQAIGRVQSG